LLRDFVVGYCIRPVLLDCWWLAGEALLSRFAGKSPLSLRFPRNVCDGCDRTPRSEPPLMWEIQHIWLLPWRTFQAAFCPAIGAA
jgi:hypothetical protein